MNPISINSEGMTKSIKIGNQKAKYILKLHFSSDYDTGDWLVVTWKMADVRWLSLVVMLMYSRGFSSTEYNCSQKYNKYERPNAGGDIIILR